MDFQYKSFDNVSSILKDDLQNEIKKGAKLSIASAYFSIYAFAELKKQLEHIEELRFIFTSPTFTTEKTPKEKREFYIPRLAREKSTYEPNQTFINQGLQGNDNKNIQIGSLKSYEPQILDKNQEVTLKNATSLQIGDAVSSHREQVYPTANFCV